MRWPCGIRIRNTPAGSHSLAEGSVMGSSGLPWPQRVYSYGWRLLAMVLLRDKVSTYVLWLLVVAHGLRRGMGTYGGWYAGLPSVPCWPSLPAAVLGTFAFCVAGPSVLPSCTNLDMALLLCLLLLCCCCPSFCCVRRDVGCFYWRSCDFPDSFAGWPVAEYLGPLLLFFRPPAAVVGSDAVLLTLGPAPICKGGYMLCYARCDAAQEDCWSPLLLAYMDALSVCCCPLCCWCFAAYWELLVGGCPNCWLRRCLFASPPSSDLMGFCCGFWLPPPLPFSAPLHELFLAGPPVSLFWIALVFPLLLRRILIWLCWFYLGWFVLLRFSLLRCSSPYFDNAAVGWLCGRLLCCASCVAGQVNCWCFFCWSSTTSRSPGSADLILCCCFACSLGLLLLFFLGMFPLSPPFRAASEAVVLLLICRLSVVADFAAIMLSLGILFLPYVAGPSGLLLSSFFLLFLSPVDLFHMFLVGWTAPWALFGGLFAAVFWCLSCRSGILSLCACWFPLLVLWLLRCLFPFCAGAGVFRLPGRMLCRAHWEADLLTCCWLSWMSLPFVPVAAAASPSVGHLLVYADDYFILLLQAPVTSLPEVFVGWRLGCDFLAGLVAYACGFLPSSLGSMPLLGCCFYFFPRALCGMLLGLSSRNTHSPVYTFVSTLGRGCFLIGFFFWPFLFWSFWRFALLASMTSYRL